MTLFWLSLAATVGLIVVHMLRPFYIPRVISAARFFSDDDERQSAERRLSLASPLRSPPLRPQILIFGLIAAALSPFDGCTERSERMGLWILIDGSASMTTRIGSGQRFTIARRSLDVLLASLEQDDDIQELDIWLSIFDQRLTEPLATCVDGATARRRLASISPRLLPTDLSVVRAALEDQEPEAPCAITHRLVVSDLPTPAWLEAFGPTTQWLDVAPEAENVGLTRLTPVVDPLSGGVSEIIVEARAYGLAPSPEVSFRLLRDTGASVARHTIRWGAERRWRRRFPLRPGRYVLTLEPGGAYAPDDRAEIKIRRFKPPRIVNGPDPPNATESPNLRICRLDQAASCLEHRPQVPLLLVGDGDGGSDSARLGFFDPRSSLLDDVRLDVLEQAGPARIEVPDGFQPVASSLDGTRVWIAQRQEPRAVVLPGPPGRHDDPVGRLATTVYGNALRWLLEDRQPSALHSLTDPVNPEPEGTRLALHPGEGKTDYPQVSRFQRSALRPIPQAQRKDLGRLLLGAAAVIFFVEQTLLAHKGSWR